MSDLIGQTIGNYRIEALIGTGGMAQVYRAVHVMLNRPAAFKVMHANLAADPKFQDRFRQEAKAAAALNHPNIIAIHDFTEQEQGGLLYLVMEYIEAGSLRTLLQQTGGATPLSLPLGIDLVQQAANGLAYAHSRGMIHRDIKPDNLLLGDAASHAGAGHAYTVKIADFGLARLVEGGVATRSGVTMGSPAYMSPEQCEGVELDGRSDLYSLGIVLYEVSTGYLPFEIKTVTDAVYKHMSVAPLSPRQVRPDMPIALNEVILRCLAKRPSDRFPTGTDLATALQAVLDEIAPSGPTPDPVRLTMQIPQATAAVPPAAPRASGRPSLPRLYVLDQNGQQQNMLAVSTRGVTLGRAADNVIVLADPMISRTHLRVDWNGQQVTVTDLGAANGTYLGDLRLTPHMPQPWSADEWLRAGPFWIYLQKAGQMVSETRPLPVSPPPLPVVAQAAPVAPIVAEPPPVAYIPPPISAAPAHTSERIRVVVEEGATLQINPGETAIVRVKLANFGDTVDHFRVIVEGMPAEWVNGQNQEVQLNPRTDTVVTLTIVTARSPEYFAGEYPVTIRAYSRENKAEFGAATADWTILPYMTSSLAIDPALATSRRQADYTVTVRNGGNVASRFALTGKDDENKIDYRFTPEVIDIYPGGAVSAGVAVHARRHWFGPAQSRPFLIEATPTMGQPPPPVRGEWVQQNILAKWMLLIPLALFVALAALYLIFKPTVVSVSTDPASPVAGQPVTVRWQAKHASKIDILQNGRDIGANNLDAKTGAKIFPTGLPGKVEVVAHSRWFFYSSPRSSTTVTAAQPTPTATAVPDVPVIEIFEPDRKQVLPGQTITLKWKVQKAEPGSIAITSTAGDNISADLKPEDSRDFPVNGDTTFTITVTNKGGKPVVLSVRVATSGPVATSNAQTETAMTATSQTNATSANQATTVANANSTAAAGSASAMTATANARANTTTAGQTAQQNTVSASQTSGVNTVSASQTVGVNTASANQTAQSQTSAAGNTASANSQTVAAGGTATALTQTATNSTAVASATGGAKTAVANTTSTAVANSTGTAAAKTQTAVAKADVNVVEKEFSITQDVSTVKAGKVSFSIENKGTTTHTYRIINPLNSEVLNISIDPGTVATPSISLTPGIYKISCAIPGHQALGMSTTLTVT